MARPSARGSPAFSRRSMIQSGMIEPNKFDLIQRADFAEAAVRPPPVAAASRRDRFVRAAQHSGAAHRHPCRIGSGRIARRLDLLDQSDRRPPCGGSIGASAAPTKKAPGPRPSPIRQSPVVTDGNGRCSETGGIQIEHRFCIRLITRLRIIAPQYQNIRDAERGCPEQLAL